ncbi:hypothetical protein [Prosthecochloris sp. CIB 2401]|uniref:hypothetical protein n=1 Tax=Prosthecochloris sp. CIB 2401 TaxID=1868325 RepID=UPI00083AE071|nr:hypothetical protein [Prosthecochloris sp. CIB 2401]
MDNEKKSGKPYRIVIEWDEREDFLFTCDYGEPDEHADTSSTVPCNESYSFPHVVYAMGNVLRKLRREPIAFPLFLLSLAFEHRKLLSEIDTLLSGMHTHLARNPAPGRFTCQVKR